MNKHAMKARNIIEIPKQGILSSLAQSIFEEDIVVKIDADIAPMGIIPKLYDVLTKMYHPDTVNLPKNTTINP